MNLLKDQWSDSDSTSVWMLRILDMDPCMLGPGLPEWCRRDFFKWVAARDFGGHKPAAALLHLTPQTMRNWAREPLERLPVHLLFCIEAIEVSFSNGALGARPWLPSASPDWLHTWRKRHGLDHSNAAFGTVFGFNRQSISLWHIEGRLPSWIAMACLGYELRLRGSRALEGLSATILPKSLQSA